jgi:SAM-dependent methyltransferase
MAAEHYGATYFAWQRTIGEFGGWANQTKFLGVPETAVVLDFGCGGGYLLKLMPCARRLGVEINAIAREEAIRNGVEAYAAVEDVPSGIVDFIVTNNALEHTTNPLAELKALHSKLKPGGKIIAVVPCETPLMRWKPNDHNWHLFGWSPMSFGNLLSEAGFAVIESRPYIHKWPPGASLIARAFGRFGFELAARIYGHLTWSWFQVRAVAAKR